MLSKDEKSLVAEHTGYDHPHQRRFELTAQGLYLTDSIGPHRGVAYFHFHEDRSLELGEHRLLGDGFHVRWSAGIANLRDYKRSLGFNSLVTAKVLELSFTEHLEVWVAWE